MKTKHWVLLFAFLTLIVAIGSLAVAVHQWNPEVGGV